MEDPTAQSQTAPLNQANQGSVLPQASVPSPITATPLPTSPPPTAPSSAPLKPEIITQNNEPHPNKALIFVSLLILVVILGIFGMFVYLKVANNTPANAPVVNQPAPQTNETVAAPSPIATEEPGIDQLAVSADTSLSNLDQDISVVDNGLNDKQGDLSEN